MKLEPIFTVKENKLYKIDGMTLVDPESLKRIDVPWSTVEMEEEMYNEEFLALLRQQLKALEEKGIFAVIVPIVDKNLQNEEDEELFIKAFNHTARRVKDCTSLAGFELPSELKNQKDFIDTLYVKHPQYVYFSKQENLTPESIVKY